MAPARRAAARRHGARSHSATRRSIVGVKDERVQPGQDQRDHLDAEEDALIRPHRDGVEQQQRRSITITAKPAIIHGPSRRLNLGDRHALQRDAEQPQVEHDGHARGTGTASGRAPTRRADTCRAIRAAQRCRACPPATRQNGRRDIAAAYYTGMRIIASAAASCGDLCCAFGASAAAAPALPREPRRRRSQPAGTMSELMVKIIYPTSDAIFYITTRTPTTEAEWVRAAGEGAGGRGVGEPADDAGPRARSGSLDAGREADARRRARRVPGGEGEGRRRARGVQRSALHVVHELSSALSPELRPASGAGGGGLGTAVALRPTVRPSRPSRRSRPLAARPSIQPTLEGRWKLRAAEDVRADGTVARLSLGRAPGRIDRRRARRVLRADHVERHAVVRRRAAPRRPSR